MSVKLSLCYFYSGFWSCCLFFSLTFFLIGWICNIYSVYECNDRSEHFKINFLVLHYDRIRNGHYCLNIKPDQSPIVIS